MLMALNRLFQGALQFMMYGFHQALMLTSDGNKGLARQVMKRVCHLFDRSVSY